MTPPSAVHPPQLSPQLSPRPSPQLSTQLSTRLSPREQVVLRTLPDHRTLAEVADALFVSRNTVKTQVASVYRKLGVSRRAEAVAVARALGLG